MKGSAPMRILVTGGAGFIGSHYVRALLRGEYATPRDTSVTVLDSFTYAGRSRNLEPFLDDPRLTIVRAGVEEAGAVDEVMPGQDAVVHFAAESHVDRSIASSAEFIRTNVVGTHTLIEAAFRHGVTTFVHVSTDEVYGSVEKGASREEDPLQPNSPYAASKAASDLIALAHHRTHGLDVRVTRCSNNYGPYQFPEKLIPLFVTNLLDGQRVPLYGDGLNVRNWLHVDDHCRAIQLVLDRGQPGEIYNIGGPTELTNHELTGMILDACGADHDLVEYVADRKGHDRRYAVSWDKIRDQLGFTPRRDFTAGLAETVRWYRENRDWWEPIRRARVVAPVIRA